MYTFLEVERQVKLPRPEAKEAEDKERTPCQQEIGTCQRRGGGDIVGLSKVVQVACDLLHRGEVREGSLVNNLAPTQDDQPRVGSYHRTDGRGIHQ